MLESARQKKCIDFLHSIKAYTCKVVQGNKKGIPDILACVAMTKEEVLEYMKTHDKIGVFVGVEVKTPIGNTSPHQLRNIKQIKHAGGFAASDITNVEDLKKLLGEFKKDVL